MILTSNDAALEAHAAFPPGTVYRLLSDDPEQVVLEDLSPKDRKREYNALRAEQVRVYALERGITQAAARVEMRRGRPCRKSA